MKKRILPALLALAMVLSLLPVAAFAVDESDPAAGLAVTETGFFTDADQFKSYINGTYYLNAGAGVQDVAANTMFVRMNKSVPANYGLYMMVIAYNGETKLGSNAKTIKSPNSFAYFANNDFATATDIVAKVGIYPIDSNADASTGFGDSSWTNMLWLKPDGTWGKLEGNSWASDSDTLEVSVYNAAKDAAPGAISVTQTGGTGTITFTNTNAATAPTSAKIGAPVTFTVSASDPTTAIVKSVKINGEVATASEGSYSFTMGKDPVTVAVEYKSTVPVFGPVAANVDLYGKKAADLGTFKYITSGTNITVTGTANYIKGWTAFNGSDVTEQSGYYLPIDINAQVAKTIVVTGSKPKTFNVTDEDPTLQLAMRLDNLTNKQFTVKIGDTTYTVNVAAVETPASPTVEVTGTPTTVGEKTTVTVTPAAGVINDTITAAKNTSTTDTATFEVAPSTDTAIDGGTLTLPVASVEQAVTDNVKVAVDVQDVGGVTLDKTALTTVKDAPGATGQDATITVEVNSAVVSTTDLPANFTQAKRFEVEVKVNSVAVEEWHTSSQITLKLNAPGLSQPKLYWVKDDGSLQQVPCTYNGGVITATVNHLSTWMVADLDDSQKNDINLDWNGKTNGNAYGAAVAQVSGATATKAAPGDTVTIATTPGAGYTPSVTVSYTQGGTTRRVAATQVSGTNNFTFTMPAFAVDVQVSFVKGATGGYVEYSAADKLTHVTNGYVQLDACDTGYGEVKANTYYVVQITQNANPASGMALLTVVKSGADGKLIIPCNRSGYISVWEFGTTAPDAENILMSSIQSKQIIYQLSLATFPAYTTP